MRANEFTVEHTNQKFDEILPALAGAALAATAGSAGAAQLKHSTAQDKMTGEITANVSKITSDDGQAIMELRKAANPMIVIEVPGKVINFKTLGTNARIKIDNGPVEVMSLYKPTNGSYSWAGTSLAHENPPSTPLRIDSILNSAKKVLVEIDLYKIGPTVYTFTIDRKP
jgi:hypothetical protein